MLRAKLINMESNISCITDRLLIIAALVINSIRYHIISSHILFLQHSQVSVGAINSMTFTSAYNLTIDITKVCLKILC